jgi:hypothetical protein
MTSVAEPMLGVDKPDRTSSACSKREVQTLSECRQIDRMRESGRVATRAALPQIMNLLAR